MNYPKLPSFRLDGKRALITGAGRGIGMGASIALAESGADVTLVSRTETELKDLTKHVNNQGFKASYEVLDVSKEEVVSMNRRLSGKEFSLNAQVGEDGDEWQDWLVDKELDHDLKFAHQEEMKQRKDLLKDSIKVLNDREKEILYSRRLNDDPTTLEDLSKKYKISRERVRQIENKAFEKLQKHMLLLAKSKNLLPVN